MLSEKVKETNVLSSKRWQVYNTMPIVHIVSLSDCAPLWKTAHKKANNMSTKKEVHQFQVACVSCLYLK